MKRLLASFLMLVPFTLFGPVLGTSVNKSGDTMTGTLTVPTVTGLNSPSASSDAANKAYVDASIIAPLASIPDSTGEMIRLKGQMRGTGRAGFMVYPFNLEPFSGSTNNGNFYTTSQLNRWVQTSDSPPGYLWFREISTNTWLGYDGHIVGFGTTNWISPNVGAYGIYKPMLKSLVGATGWADENGGAVGYPLDLTVSNIWYNWSSGSLSTPATNVTRLGIIRGPNYNTAPLCKVTITNSLGANIAPNLLPTALQYVQMGGQNNILIANGGQFADTDYVLDTAFNSLQSPTQGTLARNIPVADFLVPDAYSIRILMTTNRPYGASTPVRIYLPWITYGSDSTTELTSGATLERQGFWSSGADGSASETYTIEIRPTGSGSYYIIGGGHYNNSPVAGEQDVSTVNYVDGVAITPWARTVSRARTSNVSTIVTDRRHNLTTGDLVSIYKVSASAYCAGEQSITVVDPFTFTYSNAGSNEGTTSDTGGWVVPFKVWTGGQVRVSRETSFLHSGNNIANGSSVYTFDVEGWKSSSSITTTAALDFNTQTYFGLNSSWGGADNVGPQYQGAQNWRIIGLSTAGTLTGINTGTVESSSRGSFAGAVFWGGADRGTAYFVESPNRQMQNWATGSMFVQSRGVSTPTTNAGILGKVYFQPYATNVVVNVPSGTVFQVRATRLDYYGPNAAAVLR